MCVCARARVCELITAFQFVLRGLLNVSVTRAASMWDLVGVRKESGDIGECPQAGQTHTHTHTHNGVPAKFLR